MASVVISVSKSFTNLVFLISCSDLVNSFLLAIPSSTTGFPVRSSNSYSSGDKPC